MTATRTTLLALASRVEAATGADRELDAEIAISVGWYRSYYGADERIVWRSPDDTTFANPLRYTASLDAAMSLYITIPERIPSNPRLATAEALRQRAIAGSMPE